MKPFLILQLRPEDEASDSEFAAFLDKGGLRAQEAHRVRLDREALPHLDLAQYSGVVVGGGPGCVSDDTSDKTAQEARIETAVMSLMPQICAEDLPFMGCCYGIGILAHHLGGDVSKRAWGEPVGTAHCRVTREGRADPLTRDLPEKFDAFVGHKEAVQTLPQGCAHLIEAPTCPMQMIRYGRNVYATQFHPEADSDGFALRIRIYKRHGYFPPEEAERLTALCQAARVEVPARILSNFVDRYRRE